MAVIKALRRSPGALLGTPGLVVPAIVLFLFQVPQLVLQSSHPLLASLVSLGGSLLLLVFVPFFQGGMVGMADEALDGRSSLGTFLAAGKANYLQILIAYVLILVVNAVLGGILFVAGFGALLSGVLELGTAALAVLGIVAAVVALVYLLIAFFIQFYAQAIVLEGDSAIEGLKRSYGVVRSNLLATAGYMVVAFLVSGVLGVVFGGLSLLTTPETATTLGLPALSTGAILAVALAMTVVGAAISAFLLVYSVAFYRLIAR
ncbi:hypothetical protein [Halorarum halobium]|uniref:DUF7847 domain-containing protein n=1 Tax=Halorarum halobium TaxID=3075121 RepID=UPI0028B20BD2|nr:hypothetical protein [Halobaculum sp. XH14]